MKRCIKCILPENYIGISFNDEGICNYCTDHKERTYLGIDALKRDIKIQLNNRNTGIDKYDCVLGYSGGRDSTYLLYVLTKVLNFKVIAYSADNGLIPEQTIQNMKTITDRLNVKLIIEKHSNLSKCVGHTTSTWMKRPSLPMIEMLCTGCRLGIKRGSINFARRNRIPLIMTGGTPFESVPYRENLLKINPDGGKLSALAGYFNQILRNPKWIMNPNYFITQIKEYYYFVYCTTELKRAKIIEFSPFYNYFRWTETEILSTIQNELNWRSNADVASTWRGDCDIALLKLYLYKNILGYNDKVVHLSHLIRDGQLNRDVALDRLYQEEKIPEDAIMKISETLQIDHKILCKIKQLVKNN